jgi:pantetheine-phosphate adenylyltransferase
MLKRAIYPGTFDPVTNGHLDIIKRASQISQEIIVAVVKDSAKQAFFSYQERLDLVKAAVKGMPRVKVEGFDGLVVDFAKARQAKVIIRGLRMISDFEYEFQMALTNRSIACDIETIFLMPSPEYSFISSRLIKEVASLGGDLRKFLPVKAAKLLKQRLEFQKKI